MGGEGDNVEVNTAEQAPELPTTQPPQEATPPTETPAAAESPKKTSTLKKRPTLKWGKKRDEPPKEPEPAKDPREDIVGWLGQQIPPAVHKVNYHLLDWAQKLAVDEKDHAPLPGKEGEVTRNQFLAFLRDGNLLTKLANKLQPGAIAEPVVASPVVAEPPAPVTETSAEGDAPTAAPAAAPENEASPVKTKEQEQKERIEAFVSWAKAQTGFDSNAMTSADLLEKGKAGYSAVFETLWRLGVAAQEKFSQQGVDVDAVVVAAGQAVRHNIIRTILSFFRKGHATPAAATTEPAATDAPETEPEAVCEKKDANAAAAVAAN